MRFVSYLIIVLVVTASATFTSCGSKKTYEPEPPDEYGVFLTQLYESPRSDVEAELMALWITGKVVAYRTDYDRIRNSLARVRSEYGDSIPFLNLQQFVYPMSESAIPVFLDSSAVVQFRDGEYSDWDSLNTLYRLSDTDTSQLGSQGFIYLTFEPRLNPWLLLEYYRDLPSITAAGADIRKGDRPNVYPWFDGDDETFLFRKALGDCDGGCEYNKFWYFRVVGTTIEYMGEYAPDDGDPVPAWWGEAKTALCRFYNVPSRFCP
jgi:hypothetical protein